MVILARGWRRNWLLNGHGRTYQLPCTKICPNACPCCRFGFVSVPVPGVEGARHRKVKVHGTKKCKWFIHIGLWRGNCQVRVRRGDVGAFGGLGLGGGSFRGFWRVRRGLWLKAVGHLRIGKNGRFGSGLLQKWVRPNQGFLVKSFESTVYGLLAAAVRY